MPNETVERNPAMAQLYIVPALRGRGGDSLFSTHPDTGNRIAALEALHADMGGAAAFVPEQVARVERQVGSAPGIPTVRRKRSSALNPTARN